MKRVASFIAIAFAALMVIAIVAPPDSHDAGWIESPPDVDGKVLKVRFRGGELAEIKTYNPDGSLYYHRRMDVFGVVHEELYE